MWHETGTGIGRFLRPECGVVKHPDMADPKPTKTPDQAWQLPPRRRRSIVWLKRGLHQIYDDVANEPIPEELLKLIEDDRKK